MIAALLRAWRIRRAIARRLRLREELYANVMATRALKTRKHEIMGELFANGETLSYNELLNDAGILLCE